MENVLTSPVPALTRVPRSAVWIGRVLSGLVVAFLLVDALGKLLELAPVLEGTARLGYPLEVVRPLGVVLGLCTLLHAIPRTRLVGALLLTAYLGGAVATHVRTGTPFWFAVAMGVILWIGLALRDSRLRALVLTPAN